MSINHNNIEEFLLDYIEGNLNPVLTAELMAFLAENPEYEDFIPARNFHALTASGENCSFRSLLKKDFKDIPEINEQNFDEFCIAAGEGLLSPPEMERLKKYIGEDSRKVKNLELFNALKLRADLTVIYHGKDKLRKNKAMMVPMRFLYLSLAAAAFVAFLLLIFNNQPAGKTEHEIQIPISQNTEIKPETKNFIQKTEPSPTEKSVPSPFSAEPVIASDTPDSRLVNVSENSKNDSDELFSELKPISGSIPSDFIHKDLELEIPAVPDNPHVIKPEREIRIDSENLFAQLFSKINFWKTAETAVTGFNYLTEARISIDKTTDDQGNITELTFNTESYRIAGKIK